MGRRIVDLAAPFSALPLVPVKGTDAFAYLRGRLGVLRASRLGRDALLLMTMNVIARGIGFVATALAARCLGPVYLGLSGVVLAAAQQVSVVLNGGFDPVAVRRIARGDAVPPIVGSVLLFRGAAVLAATILWIPAVFLLVRPELRAVWLLGIPVLLGVAGQIVFAFQGMERLVAQTAVGAGSAILGAIAIFLWFRPGMPLGSDLVVQAGTAAVAVVVSWIVYRRVVRHWPVASAGWPDVRGLLGESWGYWLLGVVVFFYSAYQVPLVSYFLGPESAGVFRAAFMLAAGLELLFNSVNSLLLPRLVKWHTEGGITHMWSQQLHLLWLSLLGGAVLVAAAVLLAGPIFRLMLGAAFESAIPVFRILVVGRAIVFNGQIFAYGLQAIGADRQFVWVTCVGAAASILANTLLIHRFGLPGVAAVSVGAELFIHVLFFLALRRAVGRQAFPTGETP